MPEKVLVKDGNISNQKTMGKSLERFGEVRRDEWLMTGLCQEDRESILEHHPRCGSSTVKKDIFGICI